jgi:hypothetical protein
MPDVKMRHYRRPPSAEVAAGLRAASELLGPPFSFPIMAKHRPRPSLPLCRRESGGESASSTRILRPLIQQPTVPWCGALTAEPSVPAGLLLALQLSPQRADSQTRADAAGRFHQVLQVITISALEKPPMHELFAKLIQETISSIILFSWKSIGCNQTARVEANIIDGKNTPYLTWNNQAFSMVHRAPPLWDEDEKSILLSRGIRSSHTAYPSGPPFRSRSRPDGALPGSF